jgi:hypothetical protein
LNAAISSSSDGGKSWSAITPVSTHYPLGGSPAAPLLVEPNGQIDVLYESYYTYSNLTLGHGHNYFTTSKDGGKTWSPRIPVGGGGGRYILNTVWWIDGSIARDKSGDLYSSFDTQNSTKDTAWLSFSANDGRSWSKPYLVNPDIDSGPHIMVEVSGGAKGIAYVAWMTNAITGGWGTYLRVFHVGSRSLSSVIQVSNGTGENGVWGGDTIGITHLRANTVAVSWGYGITEYSEIYEATVST